MPIQVICPGCHARFTVSDKFGGKEGPCPKCKQKIKIPEAVAQAAMDSGVAAKPIENMWHYRQELKNRLDPTAGSLQRIFAKLKDNPRTVVFAEGEEEKVIAPALEKARGRGIDDGGLHALCGYGEQSQVNGSIQGAYGRGTIDTIGTRMHSQHFTGTTGIGE